MISTTGAVSPPTRRGVPAADVFCTDRTFGLQWRSEPGELRLTDQVSPRQPDRFNNPLVEFGHARSLAASPDGRHAYVGAEDDGILVFERVGVGADQVVDGAALLAASPGKVAFGPLATHRLYRSGRYRPRRCSVLRRPFEVADSSGAGCRMVGRQGD